MSESVLKPIQFIHLETIFLSDVWNSQKSMVSVEN